MKIYVDLVYLGSRCIKGTGPVRSIWPEAMQTSWLNLNRAPGVFALDDLSSCSKLCNRTRRLSPLDMLTSFGLLITSYIDLKTGSVAPVVLTWGFWLFFSCS